MKRIAPSLAEVIRHFTNRDFAEVSTAFPALVLAHDANANEVDVLPLVFAHTHDSGDRRVLEKYAVLPSIPVCNPRWGPIHMRAPLKKFDHVFCVACESSIGNWRESDGNKPVDPQDHRRFNPGFSVAIPGLYPQSKLLKGPAPTGAFELGLDNGGRILIDTSDGTIQLYVPPVGNPGGAACLIEVGFDKSTGKPKIEARHPDAGAISLFDKCFGLYGPQGQSILMRNGVIELNGTVKAKTVVADIVSTGPVPALIGPSPGVPSTTLFGGPAP